MFRNWRRRPFRSRPGGVPPAARRRLQQVHGLLMAGRFAEAGAIFAELAESALAHGFPQAPRLALKAAEAFFRAGDRETGLSWLRQGL